MIASTFDLTVAVAAAVMLPLIIAVNTKRQGGAMGYVWREAPNLARLGLVFLFLTWLSAIQSLLNYNGLIPPDIDTPIAMLLGIPMFVLSMIILIWGTMLLVRFLKGARTPDAAD
jgi:hypothetical protein